jgi:membrane-associated phospholipid phosphatase
LGFSVPAGGLHARAATSGLGRTIRAAPWFDALVIAWLLALYDAINNLAPLARGEALSRARGVLALERSLHIDIELTLNRWLAHRPILGYLASTYYDLAHFAVTFGMLGLLWWKRRDLYKTMRTHLIVINLIAFVIFWRFPVAPPRILSSLGFSDLVARTDALVSWHTGGLSHDANQYAAMPSLHVAWASWSALAIWRTVRRSIGRLVALLMPLFTAFAVIATGNHFVLDVLAGAATFAVAWILTPQLQRLASRLRFPLGRPLTRGRRFEAERARPRGASVARTLHVYPSAGRQTNASRLNG